VHRKILIAWLHYANRWIKIRVFCGNSPKKCKKQSENQLLSLAESISLLFWMFDDRGIDRILLNRKTRVLKEKAPLEIPKLKFYKLTGDKRSVPISVSDPDLPVILNYTRFEPIFNIFSSIFRLMTDWF